MSKSLHEILAEIADLPDFLGREVTDVNTHGAFGNTPLHVAAARGDVEAEKLLLTAGANLNVQGEHGYTALHEAVEQGHAKFAKLLLSKGARTDIANDSGETARAIALKSGDSELMELFQTFRGLYHVPV